MVSKRATRVGQPRSAKAETIGRRTTTGHSAQGGARIGLALAGGGPLGAIYEIGALCALEEALPGLDFTQLEGYVGVSAGAFIAAGLVNGLTPRQQCAAFIENVGDEARLFDPSLLLQPSWSEFAGRLSTFPKLAAQAGWDIAVRKRSKLAALERLGRALPTGIFSGQALQLQLAEAFSKPGRTNDFRQLNRLLVLVATDLDTGDAVPFGMPGHDDVPISTAVQASAALPGLFSPVQINGHSYVDGALKKTVHASVLLDHGIDLLLCLNPLVPFDATSQRHVDATSQRRIGGDTPIPRMVDGGLPLVLSQTFRSLIHSRLALGMKGYERSHPNADIVLFEPDHRDAAMYLANTFSVSQRRQLTEHAYQSTREMLRRRGSEMRRKLTRHGLTINDAVLDDRTRRLVPPTAAAQAAKVAAEAPAKATADALKRLDAALDEVQARLLA
jgi:NTE family protein